MQPPNNNPALPQSAVVGSVAQPQPQPYGQPQVQSQPQPQHQPYGQPQVQSQPQVTQFTQPQMVGQPAMMQQMPGKVVMGGGYPQTSAQTALILSIVSIFFGGICLAIPALIIANGALGITNQIPGHPDTGSAKAAQVISWIIIGLTLLVIVFFVMLMAA